MASPLSLLILSLISITFSLSTAFDLPLPKALILPIRKDPETLQYYTTFSMGSNNLRTDVVIHLGGQSLWFNCDQYNSSSYRPIDCESAECKFYKGSGCLFCYSEPRPDCTNSTCGLFTSNLKETLFHWGGLVEDKMTTYSTDGISVGFQVESQDFPFNCVDSVSMEALPNVTKGMIGLGRTTTSLHSQLSNSFKLSHKFALCIPSSTISGVGNIFIGGGPYYMAPMYGRDLSKSLITTPLLTNPVSTAPVDDQGEPSYEYFIGVKSIRVDDKVVKFNSSLLSIDKSGNGGTKLSTVSPYTVLHRSIYNALVKAFRKAAEARRMKRAAPVAPFGTCFRLVANGSAPFVDLVMQSESVKWRFYWENSMVKLKKNVWCLGFIDGGLKTRTSVILGGHQLENYLLEFDLVSSKLGFSTSLLRLNTTCAQSRGF